MSRRIEVELTSAREDGTWTWRAAGAREPKGEVAGELLPAESSVGDVLKVEAEFGLDGIDIVSVVPVKKDKGPRHETLELLGSSGSEPLVTTDVTSKGSRREGRREGRTGRRGREDDRRRQGGGRGRAERAERSERGGRDRRDRGVGRPEGERSAPSRPRRKRLKARRVHRKQALDALPEEHRPLAELVLGGGLPAVREAVQRQHELAARQNQPRIDAEPLVALAEELHPRLRTAEWHDRAEAALENVDEVDLRDLRSVVTAAESVARTDETRELAERLRAALAARVDREHAQWLAELTEALDAGRVVRALKLSSRPPKAGAPLPSEVASRLAEQATGGLTGDISQDRFAVVLEAVSFSPVHRRVAATSIPERPSSELLEVVRRHADRVPGVAQQFGVAAKADQSNDGRRAAR